jgi:hypothetical protein
VVVEDEMMRNKIQSILIVFAGSMMVAHGLRMMMQGMFYPTSYYPAPVPTSFDFWFDWFTLSFIGGIVFLWGLVEFYRMRKDQKTDSSIVPMTPT